jgi:hypothetical protein
MGGIGSEFANKRNNLYICCLFFATHFDFLRVLISSATTDLAKKPSALFNVVNRLMAFP